MRSAMPQAYDTKCDEVCAEKSRYVVSEKRRGSRMHAMVVVPLCRGPAMMIWGQDEWNLDGPFTSPAFDVDLR